MCWLERRIETGRGGRLLYTDDGAANGAGAQEPVGPLPESLELFTLDRNVATEAGLGKRIVGFVQAVLHGLGPL